MIAKNGGKWQTLVIHPTCLRAGKGTFFCCSVLATFTGVAKRVLPWLRECSRQVEAEVVSNSSNKIHQTWEALFWRPLYSRFGENSRAINQSSKPLLNSVCFWPTRSILEFYSRSRSLLLMSRTLPHCTAVMAANPILYPRCGEFIGELPLIAWTRMNRIGSTEIGKKAWVFAKLQLGRARKRINAI